MPTALETWALLLKHINDFTPIIGAILQERNTRIRLGLIGQLGQLLSADPDTTKDLAKVFTNLLGKDAEFSPAMLKQLRVAWKLNDMDAWLAEGRRLGLYTVKDIYDLSWVLAAWEIRNGRSASTGQ